MVQGNKGRAGTHLGTKEGLGFTNVRFFIRCFITADTGGRTTLVGGPARTLALRLPPPLLRFLGRPRLFVTLGSCCNGCRRRVRRRGRVEALLERARRSLFTHERE